MVQLINSRSRWLGATFLAIALSMLVLGQTVLSPALQGKAFVFYWLGCFAFTGLAAMMAVIDFFALRRRARMQQREFMEKAFREITNENEPRQSGREFL